MEAKEFKIPLVLTVVGLALLEYQLVAVDKHAVDVSIKALAIITVLKVALGIIAFFFAAKIFGIAFGTLGLASLKLAAVILFSNGLHAVIPVAGLDWVVWFIVFCSLLIWFFELEGNELIWVLVTMWVTNFLAGMLVTSVLVGLNS